MAEWLKATDCKSVHSRVRRFEPYSAHIDRQSFSEGGLIIAFDSGSESGIMIKIVLRNSIHLR